MTDRELLELIAQKIESVDKRLINVEQKVTSLEVTLENETNRNIQLLAENHINLIDKLNQAIKTQDKSLMLEVQLSGLKMKIEHLEKELAEIKTKIA